MNSLALRVSTVKTGENVKKNSDMRAALVSLPKRYQTAEETYCQDIANAKTVPEQVLAVKNIFKNLGSDARALQFLCDLFFHTPAKHAVRNQIQKLLITAARVGTGELDESAVVTTLAASLQTAVQDAKCQTESVAWNFTVTSLCVCFENFECGLQALRQSADSVLPFLQASVQRYLTELGVLSSPSVRNEYYHYIHNSIRLLLSCVQEFAPQLRQQHTDLLKQVNVVCREIVLDAEMPMDPRTNAGILMANIAKLHGEYEAFIQTVMQTRHPNEIALCVGVVSTFSQHDFQHMSPSIRDVCSKIEEIANTNATVSPILLCAARALYQISKILLNFELKTQPASDDAKLILRRLLIFTFGYMEHHMDSVRHLCRDLLRNVVATAKRIQFEFLLQKIYDACNSERLSLCMKCVVLQQTASILGASAIIRNSPNLFHGLFADHLGRDFVVNNLFDVLMTTSHQEMPFDEWRSTWCDYLLQVASAADDRLPDIEALVVKAVKCEPRIVLRILGQNGGGASSSETTERLEVPISTRLSALWAVRKSGIKLDDFGKIMRDFSEHLTYSILANCDETRIMALRLLVETHKTTEPLTPLECKHLLTFLEYNANCQSPATRQKTVGLLSKALMRCEINLAKALKQQTMPTPSPTPPKSTAAHTATPPPAGPIATAQPKFTTSPRKVQSPFLTPSTTSASASSANSAPPMKFLLEFMYILLSNLSRGANFSRRTISLTLLEQCVRICVNCKVDLRDVLTRRSITVLTEQLADSYEANKELTVRILKLIESAMDCSLVQMYNLPVNLPRLHTLLLSVRPLDSVTAAYELEFFCHRSEASAFGEFEAATTYSPTCFAALRWLLLELHAGLRMAKESLLRAAKHNPLYGLLFAVKHLLQHLDFLQLAHDLSWRILIAELIVLCQEMTAVVAPVVNSSSPEGHLPNDFGELPAELVGPEAATEAAEEAGTSAATAGGAAAKHCKILAPQSSSIDLAQVRTTPQMVLLCAWRTVKEVSLILGEIVLRSPIQVNQLSEQFLVTKEQILEIGEHFKRLLAETKHRGAFEQAYVGFAKLCSRLWRVEVTDLNRLPMQWLRELVALIARDEQINEKICATRRSAGVPFMAQALITAELQVGTTKALSYTMSHLLQLCGPAAERSIEARTHAMNIMRALFRCTDLSEAVSEFVSDGVVCSIRGYDAPTWAEKNAATLLFASLVTRIFGVQRTRGDLDSLSVRNKMTGRIFFLRYPKLFDFFLTELCVASELVRQRQKAHKLHPLLLLLSRLYPSALEGTESNLKLSEFIPHIVACAGSSELPTRYLAAKAVVALIARDAVPVTLLRRCADIVITVDEPQSLNLNALHGQLLQIYWLLKTHTTTDPQLVSDLSCTLVTLHARTQLKNAVVLKVMLDIFVELMQRLLHLTYSQDTIQNLLYFSTLKDLQMPAVNYYYPVLRQSFYMYNLHTLRLTLPFGALSDYLLNPPVTHPSVTLEQAETCLNVILLVLLTDSNSCTATAVSAELAAFEMSAMELQFAKILDDETRQSLANELRASKQLHASLKEMVQQTLYYPECATKAYAILSLLNTFDFTLTQLIAESRRHTDDVKTQLGRCVERLVLKQGVDFKSAQLCLEYLTAITEPWLTDDLRLRASKILSQIAPHYTKAVEKKKLTFVRLYAALVLSLLMDEDYFVRDHTAKIVLDNLPDNIQMDNVVSSMAQRLFLQYTADILLAMKADANYILDVFKAIVGSLATAAGANSQPGDENFTGSGESGGSQNSSTPSAADVDIFDRSEANVFGEPHKAIADCMVIFRNTFRQQVKVVNFVAAYKVGC